MPFKIFNNKVYNSFSELEKQIKKKKNLYFTNDYKKRNVKKNKIFLSKYDYDFDYVFLHFIAGLSSRKKKFKLLDFGAGLGNTYIKLKKKGFIENNIFYSLYDQNINLTTIAEKMIKKKFKKSNKLKVFHKFNDINYHDAIHFGSMLEYVENYKELINDIFKQMKKKPKYIFISDLFGTKQNDFYLIANYYGHKYFVKFHNINNLVKEFTKHNYKLIYKNPHLPNIRGKFQFFDMSNLPEKNRILNTWNLFFKHDF